MPKYDFNKVALQLYWNRTSAWLFSGKFAAYFSEHFFNIFSVLKNTSEGLLLKLSVKNVCVNFAKIMKHSWHGLAFTFLKNVLLL